MIATIAQVLYSLCKATCLRFLSSVFWWNNKPHKPAVMERVRDEKIVARRVVTDSKFLLPTSRVFAEIFCSPDSSIAARPPRANWAKLTGW